jgi:hypothetical protein
MHLTDYFVLCMAIMFVVHKIYFRVERLIGGKIAFPLYLIGFISIIISICRY